MPARAAAATWSRISASSGLTSSVGPAPAAAQEGGGDEVDRRLAPAGALHDQRPLRALDQRGDGGVLPLAEDRVGPPGQLAEDGERLVGDLGRRRSGAHGDDSRQRDRQNATRAEAGDGGGESTAMRPPDNHVHTGWSWDTPTPRPMRKACERAVALGLPAIAFTEHLDFTVWRPTTAATTDGLLDRHPAHQLPIDVEGYFAELTEVPRPVPRAAHLVRRRDGRAAPVRRQRRRAPARLPGRPDPRLAALADLDGHLVGVGRLLYADAGRDHAPLPRRGGRR